MGSCAYMNAHMGRSCMYVLHQVMEKGVGRPSRHEVAREARMVFLLYLPFIICKFTSTGLPVDNGQWPGQRGGWRWRPRARCRQQSSQEDERFFFILLLGHFPTFQAAQPQAQAAARERPPAGQA